MDKTIDQSCVVNRLMRIVSARTAQGDLPKIPRKIKPALTQIAHAEVSLTDLLRSSLQRGLRGAVEWDHYGIAVESARGYDVVVKQLLELGYIDTGINFTGADPACLLLSQTNPKVPIKVIRRGHLTGGKKTKAQLAYLAFNLGVLWNYPGKDPWNSEFDRLAAGTNKTVIDQDTLGIDQRGITFKRQEVALWSTTQQGILNGFTFPDILILDRHTPWP